MNLTKEESPGNSSGMARAAAHPAPSQAASATIHLLPQELLLLVFEIYTGTKTPVRNLVLLTLVCKRWWHIVEGTPSLWCWISGEEALPSIRKALAMAKDVPLEINYPANNAKTEQEAFFAEISGRIAQWRSLVVGTENADSASPTSELLTPRISHHIPALKAMTNQAQEMEITSFGDNDWTFTVGKFVIGTEGDALQRKHLDETLEWLFAHLGEHLKALPVSLVFFELDVDSEWFTWVASTHKVTKLELWTGPFSSRDPDRDHRNIISLLSQPLASAPTKWLFPELESIDTNVVHEYGKSKILEMVKARHSFIEAQREDARDSLLKPFREIRLRGGRNNVSKEVLANAEFLNDLQKAAKGAEIWWEDVKWTGTEYLRAE
ncbi:hypothetical protein FRC01_000299 [Tulasnella sp. 417]|nr:hypothetical protein FRC01_000299 [Tulasnella sp. 417]